MNFKETLRFPEEASLSPEAQDLIMRCVDVAADGVSAWRRY